MSIPRLIYLKFLDITNLAWEEEEEEEEVLASLRARLIGIHIRDLTASDPYSLHIWAVSHACPESLPRTYHPDLSIPLLRNQQRPHRALKRVTTVLDSETCRRQAGISWNYPL